MESQDAEGRQRLENLLLAEPVRESRRALAARMGAEIVVSGGG